MFKIHVRLRACSLASGDLIDGNLTLNRNKGALMSRNGISDILRELLKQLILFTGLSSDSYFDTSKKSLFVTAMMCITHRKQLPKRQRGTTVKGGRGHVVSISFPFLKQAPYFNSEAQIKITWTSPSLLCSFFETVPDKWKRTQTYVGLGKEPGAP